MRQEVYDSYWRLAAERQLIFHRRAAGMRPPWTDDRVLMAFKMCNAYRASDRVSQYLIRHVIYRVREYSLDDVFLRIVLFRLFSKQSTWELLEQVPVAQSRPTASDPRGDLVWAVLRACDGRLRQITFRATALGEAPGGCATATQETGGGVPRDPGCRAARRCARAAPRERPGREEAPSLRAVSAPVLGALLRVR